MKKYFILAAVAAISILAASCSKEEKSMQVFKATAEQAAENSKISLSGFSLRWSAGDQISVYDNASNNGIYALSSGAGTANGEFAHSSGNSVSAAPYSAVYPASIRTGANTVLIPSHQDSPDGTLSSLPMYAMGDDKELKFHHLCGVVRFRLSAASPVSLNFITVTTNSNITGAATITGSGSSVNLSTPSGGNTMVLSMGTPQVISSEKKFYMYLPAGNYSTFNITMTSTNGTVCTKSATSAIKVNRGQITTITLTGLSFAAPSSEGVLPGTFSVADGKAVKFSQGNLQYQASTDTWRFATNQRNIVGSQSARLSNLYGNVTGSDNASISPSYSGWIDQFGWGTSGWKSGAICYQPWSTSTSYTDYYPGGSAYRNLTGIYANADWGVYNAISNGGNAAGLWRTLTHDEWNYLLNSRAGCSIVGGTSNGRFALARVNGVGGIIVFPDSYNHPSGVAAPQNVNNDNPSESWGNNSYSTTDWLAMQTAGAVFLPAAGRRSGTSVLTVGSDCCYWSSSYKDIYLWAEDVRYAWDLAIKSGRLYTVSSSDRSLGLSVRLVRD